MGRALSRKGRMHRGLELGEAKRFHEVGRRLQRLRRCARRPDARADDGQTLEPAPEPVRNLQPLRRGRFEDHQPEVVAVDELARIDGVVAYPLDDQLQESPAVRVWFADQDPCHAPNVVAPGRERAPALV